MDRDGEHERAAARVARLMGVINTATAQLVEVVAGVLANETWAVGGIRSPEHWVQWQCGVSAGRARRLVRMARRRSELRACTALFDGAQLTEDAMATIAARVPATRDAEVAAMAPKLLHSQLRHFVRQLSRVADAPEGLEHDDEARRDVAFGADGTRWTLRARLPLDEGALVEQALTAARDAVFRERHPDADERTVHRSGVSWADALVRTAQDALSHTAEGRPSEHYQVLLHLDVGDDTARLHVADAVPDSVRRYLSCDADARLLIEKDGVLAAMSSKLRTVDRRMRAFIEERDGGCRVPGCTQRRRLHIHHIRHWEDGGRTVSTNLCALCPMHHRMHHRGELRIEGDPSKPDGLVFLTSAGWPIEPIRPLPPKRPRRDDPRYVHPSGETVDWWSVEIEARSRSA